MKPFFQALITALLIAILLSGCASAGDAVPGVAIRQTASESPAAVRTPAQPTTAVPGPLPSATQTATPAQPEPTDTNAVPTAAPEPSATQTPTAEPKPTLDPAKWGELPVIPELSPRAREILADGLARGNNPRAFSKIGDCESQADWFLNDFDVAPENYSLGPYDAELAPVIEYYAGSFKRNSLAARPGFTAASLMAPLWSDRKQCEKNETPLACEIRVHRPLVAFVLVGTNDASNPKTFEGHMRKAIEYIISQGVLPILGTKADNVERNHSINQTMARLADEYGIPLWNYWAAVQSLPGHGLQGDGVHLTFAAPRFDKPETMTQAWPVRNLNALQVLKVVMDETDR